MASKNTPLHAAELIRPVLREHADKNGAVTLTDQQLAALIGRTDRYVRYGLSYVIGEGELRSVLDPNPGSRRTLYLVTH